MKHSPPKWADRFLSWYCNPDLLEDLQGDLTEIFYTNCSQGKPLRARMLYIWHVIRSFRLSTIRRDRRLTSHTMVKSHLKIAWRVMLRNKFHYALNIAGLSIGIACFILLGFYVRQELSYDRFHSRSEDIYRVWLKEDYGEGKQFFNTVTPIIFRDFLTENFTQLEEVVQFDIRQYQVGEGDERFNERIAVISPEFFDVFDFEIRHASGDNFLEAGHVILSETYAVKYFGDSPAVGKTLPIEINGESRQFTVSAVFKDMPRESGIQFSMALSAVNNAFIYGDRSLDAWFNVNMETYALVKPGAHIAEVEENIQQAIMARLGDQVKEGEYSIGFQPLTDIHLNRAVPAGIVPVGNSQEVFILGGIALLVLTIACLNFITLSIGQSVRRYKEVGVRKVMGAFRNSLLRQYLTESTLVVAISALMGVSMAYLLAPAFNSLTGADLVLSLTPAHVLFYVFLIILLGIISGMYPGIIQSRWQTLDVLKGQKRPERKQYFTRAIVVFQFMTTVFLISCTLIMARQLQFIQSADLGFTYEATVAVPLAADRQGNSLSEMISNTMKKGELLREKLKSYPQVSEIGMGTHVFGGGDWTQIGFDDNDGIFRESKLLVVEPGYIQTFGLSLKEGRSFREQDVSDSRRSILINEAAVDYFALENPIGQPLPGREFGDHIIIGVVDNFNYSSLHSDIEPLIITQNAEPILEGISDIMFDDFPVPKLVFRYTGTNLSAVKEILEENWESVYPEDELAFSFVEEDMEVQYASERQMQRMVFTATILSIFIACLGMLGLTIMVVNSRLKEISIRKIVGAHPGSIMGLLTGDMAKQLILGFILAIPVTYILMEQWLSNFAFRIDIQPWQFLVSLLMTVIIAFLVVIYHTVSAARQNPVNSLRSE
jgi:putative ABC transport system permease protein